MPTVADLVAIGLKEAGVARVFGVPGGEIVHALDAIRQQDLPFVLTRHETAAAFMAAATARLTGAPGACLTTLGPGAANAVAGVAHAYLDRAPLVLITGQRTESSPPGHTHQTLELQSLFAPITKASEALNATNAIVAIRRCLHLAQEGRPGPVHLQLASADAAQEAVREHGEAGKQPVEAVEPEFSEGVAETAMRSLSASRRPVILAGLGLEPEGPYAELQRLAEACQAPVIVTPKAKGAITERHPLYAGTIGLTPVDPVYEILEGADCVVAIGFDPVELVKPWEHHAPLLWISNWRNDDPVIPAVAELIGPMKPMLRTLSETAVSVADSWGESRVAQHRQALAERQIPHPRAGAMRPLDVLMSLRSALPDDVLIATDVGAHKILASLEWPAYEANRFLVSNGLSSMGYGLPAAIAGCLALPGHPAVCLTGDAGLGMVMGELGTLAELGAPVMVMVFKDDALDLIRSHQRRAGYRAFGTEFQGPDFAGVAQAHGVEGVRVADGDACMAAAERFMSEQQPMLIEALIDPASYPTTPR